MKISVIGTGYVGLVTGTCFAEAGNQVTCMDIDKDKVKRMENGHIPIYEPGLEEMFKRNIRDKKLHFTSSLTDAIKGAELIFLSLPTPPGEDGSADLSYVLEVAEQLGKTIKEFVVIVNKSTVPIETTEKIRKTVAKNAKVDFTVASNPEFLKEGVAVADFMKPDRIVIGTSSQKVRNIMTKLYEPFVDDTRNILFMDERSAEMTKYAANSFLATKISFMNEIANLCEKAGADVDQVRIGIGADVRIGKHFLYAGIGYGGSCFPKDVKALHYTASSYDSSTCILKAVMETNKEQKQRLAQKTLHYFKGDVAGKTFALWGLAFKPCTDDIREAPALEIIKELTSNGATVITYDPEAAENVKKFYGDNKRLKFANNEYDALKNADALLIATDWSEFKNPDFAQIKKLLKNPVIFDGRNIFDLKTMKSEGFYYESIGRKIING
ncbi:MAG: UDP-glucose/GDP-mannose dehydrogenase family protein [Candidatus Woesebacteria bacterium]|jgi:UDPglucose 6-dehydrogenase